MKYRITSRSSGNSFIYFIYLLILLLLFLTLYFKPLISNFSPEYNSRETDQKIYQEHLSQGNSAGSWHNNILGGFPLFGTWGAEVEVLDFLNNLVHNPKIILLFLLWGGMGIFLTITYYKYPPAIAFAAAVIFSLSHYFFSFFSSGNFEVVRFIGILPWIIFFTLYLKTKRSILALGLLSFILIAAFKMLIPALIISVVVFTLLFWLFALIQAFLNGELKSFFMFSLLLLVSNITAFSAVAYPAWYLIELHKHTAAGLMGITFPEVIFIYLNLMIIFLWAYFSKYGIENINDEDAGFYDQLKSILTFAAIIYLIIIVLRFLFDLKFFSNNVLVIFLTLLIQIFLLGLYRKSRIGKKVFLLLYIFILTVCLFYGNQQNLNHLSRSTEDLNLAEKNISDNFFDQDPEPFRIYPLGNEFYKNSWGFHNQTIGGNHDFELYRYNRVLKSCLDTELQNRVPINWNILNMLNVKYLISKDKINVDNLEYAFYDLEQKLIIYKNINYLPRAWFVDKVEYWEDEKDIIKQLNSRDFDPAEYALVETPLNNLEKPSNAIVKFDSLNSDLIRISTSNDSTSLLVIGEIFYSGNSSWKAYLDGTNIPLYPVNYILRGVVVPAGNHEILLKYELEELLVLNKINLLAIILTLLFIVLGIYKYIRTNYRGEIVYVIKK